MSVEIICSFSQLKKVIDYNTWVGEGKAHKNNICLNSFLDHTPFFDIPMTSKIKLNDVESFIKPCMCSEMGCSTSVKNMHKYPG
jgi:hypothetical protein